jgi:hypothetical protein
LGKLYSITEDLEASGAKLGSVRTIFRFLEAHPRLDFGNPGPLVHYVEGLPRARYERELLASLRPRPTAHTVSMLNRVINGCKPKSARESLLGAMRAAREHPSADRGVKISAAKFLEWQESR